MTPAQALAFQLVETGLIQYGLFAQAGAVKPFQHQLGMLASYPELLRAAAHQLAAQVYGADRLLCTRDSLPLAVAVALETNIPLVISGEDGSTGPRDLVGAFDIGHPAALIALTLDDVPIPLLGHAHRFGLEVCRICALLEAEPRALPIAASALIRLPELTSRLVAGKRLPAGQGRAVLDWLAESATRRRPG